jgi:SRSO17 transposase
METKELEKWRESFEAFHERFGEIFCRTEAREQSGKYLQGLVSGAERKNGWQMAEEVGDAAPDKTQRLLYQAKWEADEARDELQAYVIEELGEADGIGIVDETGFIKKGDKSAGVARQYTGTAGKIENSQVGTFLGYASGRGHTLIDRRLFVPEKWIWDEQRRAQARIPEEVKQQTKPEQAREMLEQAWAGGVPMAWVTGDEIYGNATRLREAVAKSGRGYVFAVSSNTPIWIHRPKTHKPKTKTGGRPQTRPHLVATAPKHCIVAEAVATWPQTHWRRMAISLGEKGPIEYDWATMRIVERVDALPGRDSWLLVRRAIRDPHKLAFYLSNAPADTSLETLARVASQRYKIEQCFEEAKGETGLDHYEVRYFHSWYRHITLSMMAHAWLTVTRLQAQQREQARAQADKPKKTISILRH